MLGSFLKNCELSMLVLKSIQMISILFSHINKTRSLLLNSKFHKQLNVNSTGKNQT
jgi:hypothetical protein